VPLISGYGCFVVCLLETCLYNCGLIGASAVALWCGEGVMHMVGCEKSPCVFGALVLVFLGAVRGNEPCTL